LLVDVPTVQLSNGVHMPQVGLGAAPAEVVAEALEIGYRSFDAHRDEAGIGRALRWSGVPRHELFVATRLGDEPQAFEESLDRLGLEYVDLCLIEAPVGDFVQMWKAFEKFTADGRARAIGVCDFLIPHLRRLSEETSTVPALNQIELHPRLVQPNLRAYHSEHGIVTQAYRPLGDLVGNDEIGFMAQKYGKTPAQIILRWHMELNHVVTVAHDRMRESIDIFDFELAEDDVHALADISGQPS
jgi:2,5-diketo-D-gluconate reductase A